MAQFQFLIRYYVAHHVSHRHAIYDERSQAAEPLLSAFIKEHADSYVGAYMLINSSGSGNAYWENNMLTTNY